MRVHGTRQHAIRMPRQHLRQRNALQAARMQRVVYVLLVLHLVAREQQLLSVAHNNNVAVQLGAVVRGFVLALLRVRYVVCLQFAVCGLQFGVWLKCCCNAQFFAVRDVYGM